MCNKKRKRKKKRWKEINFYVQPKISGINRWKELKKKKLKFTWRCKFTGMDPIARHFARILQYRFLETELLIKSVTRSLLPNGNNWQILISLNWFKFEIENFYHFRLRLLPSCCGLERTASSNFLTTLLDSLLPAVDQTSPLIH